jgi:hypothetical protein
MAERRYLGWKIGKDPLLDELNIKEGDLYVKKNTRNMG